MNTHGNFGKAIFCLVSTACRELIRITITRTLLIQSFSDRNASPTKLGLGVTSAAVTILGGHFGLKLASEEPPEFPGCGLD